MDQSHPAPLALPMELLFEIIKESIALPQFFDVDHIYEVNSPLFYPGTDRYYKSRMEDEYWEIKRHIDGLRRVCKLFDDYLRRFEHRFIRLADIYHDRVPIAAISKAIRIDLTPWCREIHETGKCDFCRPSKSPKNLATFLSAVPDQEFAVEIVTGPTLRACGLVTEFLGIMYPRLLRLKAIFDAEISYKIGDRERLTRALNSTDISQLQFLHLIDTFNDSLSRVLPARNLTTFAYHNGMEPFPAWMARSTSQQQFPALQHLRFLTPMSDKNFSRHQLIAILQIFGLQLRSLRLGRCRTDGSDLILPRECWELCPQLERIDTTLTLDTLPSQDHPLHTLSIFSPDKYARFWNKYAGEWVFKYHEPFQVPFLNQISDRSHIRRIVLQQSWKEISDSSTNNERSKEYGAKILGWVHDCARTCAEKGIGLEDYDGVAFEASELAALLS